MYISIGLVCVFLSYFSGADLKFPTVQSCSSFIHAQQVPCKQCCFIASCPSSHLKRQSSFSRACFQLAPGLVDTQHRHSSSEQADVSLLVDHTDITASSASRKCNMPQSFCHGLTITEACTKDQSHRQDMKASQVCQSATHGCRLNKQRQTECTSKTMSR